MASTIQVKEKTVNNREVISFSKEYRGQEHEVFAPKEHATQVLLSLLAILNQGTPVEKQFVLARKGDIGAEDVQTVDSEMAKSNAVRALVAELFDDETAVDVEELLENHGVTTTRQCSSQRSRRHESRSRTQRN